MNKASRYTYAGLFGIALSTVMYEILLTRIFSVTMWYHFAFVSISIAMFGMTVGAVIVYRCPHYFREERVKDRLALHSIIFSGMVFLSFLIHLRIPITFDVLLLSLLCLLSTFLVISLPFVFSGICVCLALTKFRKEVSQLYAADLAGASVSCLLIIGVLKFVDGPTAVIIVSLLSSLSAYLFCCDQNRLNLKRIALALSIFFALAALGNGYLARQQKPLLSLHWVKGKVETPPLYQVWNSFSRVAVTQTFEEPFGWGLSSKYQQKKWVNQLWLEIDAGAATALTEFDGSFDSLEHLNYDVTNYVHHISPNSDILVIGSGGGRDILSALSFSQKNILALEINEAILNTVLNIYGDFTGNLDAYPNVRIVNDEARSFITRNKQLFDIIQISLIDTWAATAAGALSLTENSLYTLEAWDVLLSRLQPGGMLSISRWYSHDRRLEMYRALSLARSALLKRGISHPRDHIYIVTNIGPEDERSKNGIGTLLVSTEPFSRDLLDTMNKKTDELHFTVLAGPMITRDPFFDALSSGKDIKAFLEAAPYNLSPPTDNDPFFFNMLRLRDFFKKNKNSAALTANAKVIGMLYFLLFAILLLSYIVIVMPLRRSLKRSQRRRIRPLTFYFSAIGLGFMLVEISQIQRLAIFLGHPVYSLSVVLFALLLFSGMGSYLSRYISETAWEKTAVACLGILVLILFLFGFSTTHVIEAAAAMPTHVRILISIALLFPMGIFMGMAFPLGMGLANSKAENITPWLWGVNGAASVVASVLAAIIALSAGISSAFWTGVFCYIAAIGLFVRAEKIQPAE